MGKVESIDIPGKGLMMFGENISMQTNMALSNSESPRGTKPMDTTTDSYEYAPWGLNDDTPNLMIADANLSTIITPGVSFKADMLYGAGIGVKNITDQEGQAVESIISPTVFREFYKKSRASKAIKEAFVDVVAFGMAFAQISLNEAGNKINLISCNKTRARMVRLGKKDANGNIKQAYVNSDFGLPEYTKANNKILPLIDTAYDPAEWLREYLAGGGSARHFIYPIANISLNAASYYPAPDWNTARTSKWLSVSTKIAKLKDYLMDNMMNLKYHIEFNPKYWDMRFGAQWREASDKEKIEIIQEETNRIDKFFRGIEGGNIFASQQIGQLVGDKLLPSITIHEFKQFFTDGVHIEDSQEASAHLLFSLGLHTSMFGSGAKQGLSGNGSENRVSYAQRRASGQYLRDEMCMLFEMVRDFNQWPNSQSWEFYFKDTPDIPTADKLNPETRDLGAAES